MVGLSDSHGVSHLEHLIQTVKQRIVTADDNERGTRFATEVEHEVSDGATVLGIEAKSRFIGKKN